MPKAKSSYAKPPKKKTFIPTKVSSKDGEDLHEIERRMVEDIGLFRQTRPMVTVESLLRDYHANENIEASMAPIRAKQAKKAAMESKGVNIDKPTKVPRMIPFTEEDDNNLVSALTKRLTNMERLAAHQASQLIEKDEMIGVFRNKVTALEVTQKEDQNVVREHITGLTRENERLKRQAHEMETFLNDYGLIWVGYRASDDTDLSTTDRLELDMELERGSDEDDENDDVKQQQQHNNEEIYFSIEKLMSCIADINSLADDSSMEIIQQGGMHKLAPVRKLRIIFFRNGFFFKGGPLRSYALPETRAFIKDIMDGYFPYELKDEFPDGTVFDAIDRTSELWTRKTDMSVAPIMAARGIKDTRTNFATSGVKNAGQSNLMRNLPKRTISKGKVIEIRHNLRLNQADIVTPSMRGGLTVVQTPTLTMLQKDTSDRPSTPGDIATLRVKLDDGTPNLILKMRFNDSVGEVRGFILNEMVKNYDLHKKQEPLSKRPRPTLSSFELRTNFPKQVYSVDKQTLFQAGLVPGAGIFVRTLSVTLP